MQGLGVLLWSTGKLLGFWKTPSVPLFGPEQGGLWAEETVRLSWDGVTGEGGCCHSPPEQLAW